MDKVFQALASKPRRDILNYLQMGEMSAGEISTKFRFSKPALSGHLRILENAGLIERDKRGQFVFFKLLPVRLEETVIGWSLNLTAEAGFIIALILAVLLAFSTTLKWRGSAVLRAILFTGASAPMFLLGIVGLIVFYQKLGWVPANGRTAISNPPTGPTGLLTVDGLLAGRLDVVSDALHHLMLPALVIALGPAVAIGRVLRSSLLTDMDSDYARTARAKGLPEGRIVASHVLRNCVGSALSMTGLQVGLMFSGVLVVEQVFGWPGIGQYIAQSIPVADFPAIAGVTLMLGALYVFINTAVDLLQAAADPRIAVTGG